MHFFVCDILSWKWCYVLNQILIGLSFQTPLQFLENGLFPEVRGEKKQTELISDDYLQGDYSNSFQQGLHFFLFFVFKRSNFGELLNM